MANCDDLFSCFISNENDKSEETLQVSTDVVPKTSVEDSTQQSSTAPVKDINSNKEERKSLKRRHQNDVDVTTTKVKNTETFLDDISLDILSTRITVHTLKAPDSCTHEVAVYPGDEYVAKITDNIRPAKQYAFVLDPFQKEAIMCIENHQSVLVSAHTSAGKTVVAEYAIAKSLQNKQRVIYTTPIKALSNQKYREFNEEFKDVGLVTGDVTINPSASCLIMTTEILRNMLYRGSEIMREVGWVIFDEIHYMRDKERGVVWEETLILLPDNVRYVFLSATIPNARQFAEWVCHLHKQPCHVVYTDYRPTPLQHYIFPAGGDGIHLIVDEKGTFKETNFNSAMAILQSAGEAAKGDQKGRKGGLKSASGGQSNIFKIVKMIMERNFAPVIIFSFSKKECELYAMQMAKLDFNTQDEKKLVDEIYFNAIDILSDEDRRLPQVENVLPLLRRGIGIHHGGLLPILKEIIEILFAENLLKALFATETFAMGLNMPARTVLFTAPRKYDGKDFRWISSGEYIQMAGRAGRRGLDDKGIVILMVDESVSPAVGKSIVQGKADPINSAFHLTYNMVLNLLRVDEINPEYMLERSFFQFQNQTSIPELYKKVQEKQEQINNIKIAEEHSVSSYYHIRQQLQKLGKDYCTWITKPRYLKPFLTPGRLIKVSQEHESFDWGVIVNFKQKPTAKSHNPIQQPEEEIIVDVLLHVSEESLATDEPKPCKNGQKGNLEVVPVYNRLIEKLSTLRVHIPSELRSPDSRRGLLKTIAEIKKRFPDGLPLLNGVSDMQIDTEEFKEVVKSIKDFEERLYAHPLHSSSDLDVLYPKYELKVKIQRELTELRHKLKEARSLLQMDELKHRKRVLRRLQYCTNADVIEFKGRVACELSSADELLLTEMIFNDVFKGLQPAQTVALLSCFVCDEKSSETPAATTELSGPIGAMKDLARRIAKVSNECKIEVDEDSYLEKFKPFMMDVVLQWCNGASFASVCKMTDIFEGSIIRCMRRLEELLRQLIQAAKTIGNNDLENKFTEGIKLLKRDIVFAASLYL